MDFTASSIPYTATGYFSDIICDYLKEEPAIRPYYQHPVSLDGLEAAIQARSAFATDRPTLV
ncbi:MAG TPA: bacillithiol biosynthesis BshC, partial [Chitinophagaceae bacterium]|nr:bacillithiol biosynthesis BshC [Chitinophagaceae bacterium]